MLTFAFLLMLATLIFADKSKVFQNYYDGIPDNCPRSKTPNPFTKIGEKYYHLELNQRVNWHTAAHNCKKMGANLASIENDEEMRAINSHLNNLGQTSYIWLSGNDLDVEGKFQWFGTGNDMTYTKWDPGQPDNRGSNEHCVHLWKKDGRWTWNNWPCDNTEYYLCQANDPRTVTTTVW